MPSFAYSAHAPGAATITASTVEAVSRREALRLLQTRGLQVVRLEETEHGAARSAVATTAAPTVRPASARERLPFLEALAELVSSGMSAGEAVRLLAGRLQEPRLRSLCSSLWTQLGEGGTLSQAMAKHPAVFDAQTNSLIAAGEATGNLQDVLARLIQHFTEQRDLRQQFLASLAYPAFICMVGGGVALFLVVFLVPRLQSLLASLGGTLPAATQLLVDGSQTFVRFGPVLGGALVGIMALFVGWQRTPAGRGRCDAWLLRLPVVREFVVQAAVLNFTHTLAILLENGITTAEALRLTERTAHNSCVQRLLRESTNRVLEGASLCGSLGRTGLMKPLLLDRLAVGEQTGSLAPSLRQIAHTCQTALTRRLHVATRLVSGVVLFLTFAFVAFLAYAIVTALFQVSASFRL
jgi:general secretion pathway protein F